MLGGKGSGMLEEGEDSVDYPKRARGNILATVGMYNGVRTCNGGGESVHMKQKIKQK